MTEGLFRTPSPRRIDLDGNHLLDRFHDSGGDLGGDIFWDEYPRAGRARQSRTRRSPFSSTWSEPAGMAEPESWCVAIGLPGGPVCGSGILISTVHVLTCAHTVPGGRGTPYGVVVLFAHAHRPVSRQAWVVGWLGHGANGEGDLAVLELDQPAPEPARPVALGKLPAGATTRAVLLRQYSTHGDRLVETHARLATNTKHPGGRFRIDIAVFPAPSSTGLGFSGAGVVDRESAEVLGMVVAADRLTAGLPLWMVDFDAVRGRWPALAAPRSPATDSARPLPPGVRLAHAVADLPTMRTQYGRDQLVDSLSRQIASAVPRNAQQRFDVLGIVRTCLDYSTGLAELLALLWAVEGDSCAMQKVQIAAAAVRTERTGSRHDGSADIDT